MALNTDFKVKDSLYVGNSACFVTQTDTPKILSAGEELFDIFVQQNEVPDICTISQGTGIATFSYDGSADVTVAVNSTCNSNWNSAYDWCQANSGTVLSAATYVATNGSALIDTVAEGTAQGQIGVTNIANTTSQIDVNGLQTDDSPQFAGACFTGAVTTSSTIDGRDIACDGGTLDTLQSLSGDNGLTFSSPSQGTLRVTELDGDTTDIDLQVQTADDVQFANICSTGNLSVDGTVDGVDVAVRDGQLTVLQGLSAANVVSVTCTSQGTLRQEDASGTCTAIDTGLQAADSPTFAGLSVTGLPAATDNTVVIMNGTTVSTDEIDSRVWGSSLVDGAGNAGFVPVWTDGDTLGDSLVCQSNGNVTIDGGLSATGILSGDGTHITNVAATSVDFPSTAKSDLDEEDRFFIQDDTDGSNKSISYGNLLIDAAGTNMGLEVSGSDSLALKNFSGLSNSKVSKWDDTNGQFVDSIITETGAGDINIGGGLTVTDNLSVMGTITTIDTSVSVTSALSVVNAGTGPAIYAEQTGATQPIAKFVDTEGGQVVIGDTGNVGIGGSTDNPGQKLVVTGNACITGNISIDGDTTLGNASGDDVTINSAVINAPNIATGSQLGDQVLVRNADDEVVLDSVDSKIFGESLVDSSAAVTCANQIPKFSNTTGTIGDSTMSDDGVQVSFNSDILLGTGHKITTKASGTVYSEEASFTASVGTTATTVTTFTKSGLNSVKYLITLKKGVNITTFEVNAVYNGTDACGTTYAIVDAQAASQLSDITITNTGTTIDLNITAASATTTAIIQGTALYS